MDEVSHVAVVAVAMVRAMVPLIAAAGPAESAALRKAGRVHGQVGPAGRSR